MDVLIRSLLMKWDIPGQSSYDEGGSARSSTKYSMVPTTGKYNSTSYSPPPHVAIARNISAALVLLVLIASRRGRPLRAVRYHWRVLGNFHISTLFLHRRGLFVLLDVAYHLTSLLQLSSSPPALSAEQYCYLQVQLAAVFSACSSLAWR